MLIVEDGTNVPGANSFVSRAAIIAYGAVRGVVFADDETTDQKAIRAIDYIVSQPCYKGYIVYPTQSLPFPRMGIFEGDEDFGYVYEVPSGVQRAQLQLCCDIASGIDILPSRAVEPQLKRRKVGPIEREWYENDPNNITPLLPIAAAALAPYECGQGVFGIRTYRV